VRGHASPGPVTPDLRTRESSIRPGSPMVSRMLRTLFLIGGLTGALAASGHAGTIGLKLGLAQGKLAVTAPATSLKAGATMSLKVRVADARGTGAGWTLRFAHGKGLTVTAITARCGSRSTCTLPAAAAKPSGKTVFRAAKATGMGLIDLVVTVRATAATTVGFAVS
jgi:hypothetical protein